MVQLLVEQTLGREAALPLLQVALQQIWDALPRDPAETLRALGGVGGALANTANRVFEGLSTEEQHIARRAFLTMVNLGEGAADTRRRAVPPEMVAAAEQVEDVERVLQRFSRWEVRLVSLSGDAGSTTAELTHKALISQWGQLREWLAQNRQDVRFARRINEAAESWKGGTGGLWRPPELDLLLRYAERHAHDLTQPQRELLDASLADHQAEQRKEAQHRRVLMGFAWIMTVLALIAAASGGMAYMTAERARFAEVLAEQRAEEADRGRRIATARAASVQAVWLTENGNSDDLAERAAALARESWRLFPTPSAHAAADRLVRSLPTHRIEHGEPVNAVAFDPHGRWLAMASGDLIGIGGSARVIDPETGRELRRIEHGAPVKAVAFDPHGRWLVTASGGSVRVIHADPDYTIDLLCGRAGRNLSRSEWQIYLPGEPYRKTWRTGEGNTPLSEPIFEQP